jgi:hypothetical protein
MEIDPTAIFTPKAMITAITTDYLAASHCPLRVHFGSSQTYDA